jgi:YidC/Oxa1 family membrane protein insertase
MLGLLGAPLGAAYDIVFALAHFLTPLAGGLATAAAIVLFTVGVRLLLSPLSVLNYRGQANMSKLQPKIAELRRKHARQPDRLQ